MRLTSPLAQACSNPCKPATFTDCAELIEALIAVGAADGFFKARRQAIKVMIQATRVISHSAANTLIIQESLLSAAEFACQAAWAGASVTAPPVTTIVRAGSVAVS